MRDHWHVAFTVSRRSCSGVQLGEIYSGFVEYSHASHCGAVVACHMVDGSRVV